MGWLPESIWTPDVSPVAALGGTRNPHVFLDPVAAMAAAATSTERITLATCVTDPLRRHPAMIANEFLTLHHMTNGRVVLGIGAGEGVNTVPYGIDYRHQVSKFEEALQVIRLLWEADGQVDFDGRWFPLRGAVLGLGPYEGTFPEIWIGAIGPRMCELAGRYGDGWLPMKLPIDDYRTRLSWIHDARRAIGRDPSTFTAAMRSYAALAEDHDEAHRLINHPLLKGYVLSLPDWIFKTMGAEHPLGKDFHGLTSYIPAGMPKEEALDAIRRVPFELVHEYFLHGTPADVVEQIRPYVDAGGTEHIILNLGVLADPSTVISSSRLFSEIVQEAERAFRPAAAAAAGGSPE
jgi:phthiodiolone/phenolphthiodiolone dimycocerosates ketoreductase